MKNVALPYPPNCSIRKPEYENNEIFLLPERRRLDSKTVYLYHGDYIENLYPHIEKTVTFHDLTQQYWPKTIPDNYIVRMRNVFDFYFFVTGEKIDVNNINIISQRTVDSCDEFPEYRENDINLSREAADKFVDLFKRNIYLSFEDNASCDTDTIYRIAKIKCNNDNELYDYMKTIFIYLFNSCCLEALKNRRFRDIVNAYRVKYKKSGHHKGTILNPKKRKEKLPLVYELSKDFKGSMKDTELMKELNVSRNTLKSYKKILSGMSMDNIEILNMIMSSKVCK